MAAFVPAQLGDLPRYLAGALASRQRIRLDQTPSSDGLEKALVPAAVAVLLVPRSEGPTVIFTRRTSRVEHHKGQISFPGGGRDSRDSTVSETALRETYEEIGIHPSGIQTLGLLDDMVTTSDFVVTPVVGMLSALPVYRPSEHEVDEVFEISLATLLHPHTRVDGWRSRLGSIMPTYTYPVGPYVIWGATGRILKNFLDITVTFDFSPATDRKMLC